MEGILFYKTTLLHKWFIYSNLQKYLILSLKFDKLSKEEIKVSNKKIVRI